MPTIMIQRLLNGRSGYFIGAAACFSLIALALYIQQKNGLDPCPLCIFQRIAFMVMGAAFLVSGLHNPNTKGRKRYAGLHVLIAAVGIGIATRHIWIQTHPESVMAECGADLGYMFQSFPMSKVLQLVFRGSGECTSIDWTFLGFTIPQLSLAAFVVLASYAIFLAFAKNK